MTVRSQEMRVLMPSLLGVDPSSKTSMDWESAVARYWNSLSVPIPSGGMPIEVGFRFDLNDETKIVAIQKLIDKFDKKVDLSTEELVANYVMDNIKEEEKYLYGTPISIFNYLLWRYCENYRDVANTPDSNKGARIRFFIYDELDNAKVRKQTFATQQVALRTYFEILANRDLVMNVMWALKEDVNKMDSTTIDMTLRKIAETRPDEFVAVVGDPTLTIKAKIERYIAMNVLRRVEGSTIIVDNADSSIVIGNSMNDAIAYFSADSPINKQNIANYAIKYKGMKQSIKESINTAK